MSKCSQPHEEQRITRDTYRRAHMLLECRDTYCRVHVLLECREGLGGYRGLGVEIEGQGSGFIKGSFLPAVKCLCVLENESNVSIWVEQSFLARKEIWQSLVCFGKTGEFTNCKLCMSTMWGSLRAHSSNLVLNSLYLVQFQQLSQVHPLSSQSFCLPSYSLQS